MTAKRVFHITKVVTLGLGVGLAMMHASFAQEGGEETGPGREDLGLSAGELVPHQEIYDDWIVVCNRPAGEALDCTMFQPILNALGTPAARINIWPITNSNLFAAAAAIVTPLGTNLEIGIEMAVDDNTPRRYTFKYCVPDGCLARIGILKTEINAMKTGSTWKMVLFEFDNTTAPIEFDLSLNGFTAAYARLEDIQSEGLDLDDLATEPPTEN